jgi:Mrp family chromosome partitioning ATPase
MTDGVIFAVYWGRTLPRQARLAVSMLRSANANLLGAVVTRTDMRKHARYAYGDVGDVYYRHTSYYRP